MAVGGQLTGVEGEGVGGAVAVGDGLFEGEECAGEGVGGLAYKDEGAVGMWVSE